MYGDDAVRQTFIEPKIQQNLEIVRILLRKKMKIEMLLILVMQLKEERITPKAGVVVHTVKM